VTTILSGNLLVSVARILDMILSLYLYVLIAAVIVSWVNADPWNPIVRTVRQLTNPVLYRVRKAFPFLAAGGVDFSPIAVVAIVYFLQNFLVNSILDYGLRLKHL